MKSAQGFTLIEVILVLAVVGLFFGLTAGAYESAYVRNDAALATETIVETLRRAQVLSQAVNGDVSWGVFLAPGSVTLFKGATYGGRDPSFDEVSSLPGAITLGGLSEVIFSKISGEPGTAGIITVNAANSEAHVITLNPKGAILY